MNNNVMSVSGLSKKFAADLRRSLRYGLRDITAEFRPGLPSPRLAAGEFWALEDVSFEIAPGESLAVIGDNGSGKSTLLKILHGLLKPDAGEIRVRGRSQAIIELGTGFNGLLTGRENVEVGAALHGFDKRQGRRLLDQVIEFAELDAFIDAPVQSYSSGMKARLSYALSAHLEPDLLLVDEVLAVGDLPFQRKCISHMRGYLDAGGALILVSHNTYQVQAVCQRGMVLNEGRAVFSGGAMEALNHMFERRSSVAPRPAGSEVNDYPVAVEDMRVASADEAALRTGAEARILLQYRCDKAQEALWGFGFWTADHWVCIAGGETDQPVYLREGGGTLSCSIPQLPLLPGRYVLRAALLDPITRVPLALAGWKDAGLPVEVRGEATAARISQRNLNQLVTLPIIWN